MVKQNSNKKCSCRQQEWIMVNLDTINKISNAWIILNKTACIIESILMLTSDISNSEIIIIIRTTENFEIIVKLPKNRLNCKK